MFYEALKMANHTHPSVMLGPEYSSAVQLISSVADVYSIPIMAFWATSPYLSSKDQYPNVWRTISSDAIRMLAWVEMCVQHQWAHVVVIEESSLYGRGASEYFDLRATEKGIRVWRVLVDTEADIPSSMAIIRSIGAKIIVAPCAAFLTPIVQRGVEDGMMGPKTGYVWIIGDTVSNLLVSNYSSYYVGSLTALEPNGLLRDQYNRSEYAYLSNVAYDQVKVAYDAVNISNPFRIGTGPRMDLEAARPLMWTAGSLPTALARALFVVCESAANFFNANRSLPTASDMKAQLKAFSDDILGSNVHFDEHQDFSSAIMGLVNMRPYEPFHVFGNWSPQLGLKMGPKEKIIWPDGTTKIPDDGIALETYYTRTSALGVIVISLALAMCMLFLLTFLLMLKYFKTPVFRFASPYSLLTILVGLFLLTLGIIFYLDRPSRALCQLRIWCYYVGLTFIYSALIAKTWRVWMVFRESNSLQKGIIITNTRLMIYTGVLIIPAIFLVVLRTAIDDDYDQRVLSKDISRVDVVCQSKHQAWAYTEQGWTGIQMFVAALLSFKTRNVPSGFNEAKHVFISVYVVCTVGIIGLITSTALQSSSPKLANIFLIFSTIIVTGVMWAMLFIPKLYIAVWHPEQNTPELMKQRERPSQHSITDVNRDFATDTMQVPLMDFRDPSFDN